MNFSPNHLIKILEINGFLYKRSKGSHQIFFNPTTNKTIIVPVHGNKDIPKVTFFAILEQAGISKDQI